MNINTNAIRERVTARAYGWSQAAGAPEPVRRAAAAYRDAVNALDDALVDYEVEEANRRSILRQHNEAVAEALRAGKKPPVAKVPSAEELEVRHGAVLAARESFVHEAAQAAERVSREVYAQWRADTVEQLQAAAAAVRQVSGAAVQAITDWATAAEVLARLDRSWATRTGKFDSASVLAQSEHWGRISSIESTQMVRAIEGQGERLAQYSVEPIVTEFDPDLGEEQYSAAYLSQQSPGVREGLQRQAAESGGSQPMASAGWPTRVTPDGAAFIESF